MICQKSGVCINLILLYSLVWWFFYGILSLAHAERQAINTIIQGSAADVTKMAMIKVDRNINRGVFKSQIKLVMHLHDELIFEVLELFLLFSYAPQ